MPAPKKKPLPPAAAAAKRARAGDTDGALAELVELADRGDFAACASCAEVFAFRGQWSKLVPYATELVAHPHAVQTSNVFSDTTRLLRRAARELGDDSIVREAAARVPASHAPMRDASLTRDLVLRSEEDGPADVAAYERARAMALKEKRFKGKPEQLARHCFALAENYRHGDALIELWSDDNPMLGFEPAVWLARVYLRRGDEARAWALLLSKLALWYPVDAAQVAPAVLVTDRTFERFMTPERGAVVLATPRGPA